MMLPHSILIVSCGLLLILNCQADVGVNNNRLNGRTIFLRQQRLQRLETVDNQTPYPAVGFRPQRPFDEGISPQINFPPNNNINNNNNNNNLQFPNNANNNVQETQSQPNPPDALYGAPSATIGQPARLRQLPIAHEGQQAEQLQFSKTRLQSARLTGEREERELAQETPTEIEVDVKNAAETIPVTPSATAVVPQTPTFAYYPAGAVSFVKPLTGAASPVTATYIQYPSNAIQPFAKLIANPAQLSPVSAASYYAASFVPQAFSYNGFGIPAAQLQAW